MARALAILLGAIFSVFILRRKMTLVLDLPVITKTIFAGGVMAAVILGIQFLWYSKFLLPVYLLVGVVVYMVLLRLLKAVEVADLDLLKRFFGAKLSFISKILRWILLPSNTKN